MGVLAVAYLGGGYVAGRMARFDGWRQGLGVWLFALGMTLALATTAWIAGGDINPLESLSLPRIPVEEGALTRNGAIVIAAVAAVTLSAALLGGQAGERFHRDVDAAGAALDEDLIEASESAPSVGAEADSVGAEADSVGAEADSVQGGEADSVQGGEAD